MPALNFQDRWANKVERGEKPHTIRAWRKRPFKVGDRVYLYTGMRTKACRKLGESNCVDVRPITIRRVEGCAVAVILGDDLLSKYQATQLAQADGFDDLEEFAAFFVPEGTGTFFGQFIKWGIPIAAAGERAHRPVQVSMSYKSD